MTVHIFISVWDFSWHWSCCTQRIAVVIKKQAPAGEGSTGITLHQTAETVTLMKTYVISYTAPATSQKMRAESASHAPRAPAGSRLDQPWGERRNRPRLSRPPANRADAGLRCRGSPKKAMRRPLLLSFPQSSPQSSNCQRDEALECITLWAIKAFWWSSWEISRFFPFLITVREKKINIFTSLGGKKNICLLTSLSLINLEVTSNYFSWLKCVPSIWTVQLAGARFFWMHIFAWPLLRERCEVFLITGYLNGETLEADLKPNMHLFQWHSARWVKCVHMVGKLLKHPVALSHLTPAWTSIYRGTFNFTGRKRHRNAGCIKLCSFNYLILFSTFILLIFFPAYHVLLCL